MKRVLAFVLAAMMVFALAACGEDTTTPTTTAPTAGSSLELGKVNGLTWENEFIGLGCTLTSEWTFKSEEEIRQLNNIVEGALDGNIAELLKNATVIYDMTAATATGCSVSVNLEKVSNAQLDALQLVAYLESSFNLMETSLSNMGLSNIQHEITTGIIDGKTMDILSIKASIYGVAFEEAVFAIKCDGYIACVAIGVIGDTTIEDMLSTFYFLDK